MAGATAVPFLVFDRLGGGARMSGVILSLHSLAYALVSLGSSGFMTRARNGLVYAMVGAVDFAVLVSVSVLMRNPYLFGLVSTAGFAGLALIWPALWSWLGAEPDVAVRARRIAHYNVSWSIGLALGPLFAGPLYVVDYRLPFLLVCGLATAALVLVWTLPHERQYFRAARLQPDEERSALEQSSERHLYYAWYANMLGWVLLAAARSVFPKRVDDLADSAQLVWLWESVSSGGLLSQAAIAFSWLSFMLNASRAVVFLLMGWTKRWQQAFAVVVASQVIAGAAFWVLGSTHSFVVMLFCCALAGLNGGVCFFASVFYSLADPMRKHQRAAINEAMVGAGGFIGSMGFGMVAGSFGVTMPFRWTPVLILFSVVVQVLLFRYGLRKRQGPV
jgi:MFS family permease